MKESSSGLKRQPLNNTPAKPLRSHCPVNFGLETFGDKWTLLIIRDIVFYGKRTYGEFLKSEEGIATNILADRLAMLIEQSILSKAVNPRDKRKDIFLLTDKGLDLIPILLQIEAWSGRHDPKTDVLPDFTQKIRQDFDGLCEQVRAYVIDGQAAACRLS